MPRFDKLSVLQKIKETGIVPVFYHKDVAVVNHVIQACYDGGIRVFEFTNRGDGAHQVFAECEKYVALNCPEMVLGVGSVVDAPTAALYIQLGASFVVGPLFNPDIAVICNRRLVPYCPGCGTISEIGKAQECGCDLTKIFPGEIYGSTFVKNLLAPCPWTKVMVTGGVAPTKESIKEWFSAGVFCIGMGSKLLPKDVIVAENWEYITQICKDCLQYVVEAK